MQRSALCRFRRELSNAYFEYYFLAKVGFDTAVNKPCKVCPLSAYRSPRFVYLMGLLIVGICSCYCLVGFLNWNKALKEQKKSDGAPEEDNEKLKKVKGGMGKLAKSMGFNKDIYAVDLSKEISLQEEDNSWPKSPREDEHSSLGKKMQHSLAGSQPVENWSERAQKAGFRGLK